MNMDEVTKLNNLFSIVEQCAKHRSFPQLTSACMGELKKYEADPTLLGIEYDKPEPRVVEPVVHSPPGEPPIKAKVKPAASLEPVTVENGRRV